MNLPSLVFQHQNRYKFWNWDEVFVYTNLTPTQAKNLIDSRDYLLQDPFSALVYSHKNNEPRALDNLYKNYLNTEKFELGYNDYGVSANFVIEAQSPTWQNFNHNQDWYWKQNWNYKFGQYLFAFPGIKNIYLGCSAALENSHHGSDIDLIIQTHANWVWITKAYFAILSKVLKYYNLNFLLAGFYYFSNQKAKLETLKHNCTRNKIKIDFGLVFEDKLDLQKYYSNIERNVFICSALKLASVEECSPFQESSSIKSNKTESLGKNSVILSGAKDPMPSCDVAKSFSKNGGKNNINFIKPQEMSNPPQGIFRFAQDDELYEYFNFDQAGSIIYKPKINPIIFRLIQILLLPTVLLITPFAMLNYWYEQKNKYDYNKLVLWNIYSQYNLIY